MKIALSDIRGLVTKTIFDRGIRYYKSKRVILKNIQFDSLEAVVRGTNNYLVEIIFKDGNIYPRCNCPYWDTCKHIVATLFEAKDYYSENQSELIKNKNLSSWEKYFDNVLNQVQEHSSIKKWRLIYLLKLNSGNWILSPYKVFLKQNGELGRLTQVARPIADYTNIHTAKNDPVIVNYLLNQSPDLYYNSYYTPERGYNYGEDIGNIFDLLHESFIYKEGDNNFNTLIQFTGSEAKVEFKFIKKKEKYTVESYLIWDNKIEKFDSRFKILADNPVWIFWDNTFIKVNNVSKASLLLPYTSNSNEVNIPENKFPQFVNTYLSKLGDVGNFLLPKNYKVTEIDKCTGKRIYLSESENSLEVSLKILYNEYELDCNNFDNHIYRLDSKQHTIFKINREMEYEKNLLKELLESGLQNNINGDFKITSSKTLSWIFNEIPLLVKKGFEIYGKEKLNKYRYNSSAPTVNLGIKSDMDWFDLKLNIDYDGVELPVNELLKAIKEKTSYVKLIDGSVANLPDNWFNKFDYLFCLGKINQNNITLSKHHLILIELLIEDATSAETDEQFQEKLKKLKEFDKIKSQKIPENFHGVLRDYQKAGYDWLCFLKNFGFGGCLADDMGLGKTVQALALLLKEKNNRKQRTSLIVCPTSVVYNWQNEIIKFTPELKVLNHTSNEREKNTEHFDDYDIVITSYGILLRDISFLAKYKFHYAILDESQKIKNSNSLTAKAARLLKSNHRLALTGTPIENNTSELWSLFSFLNPGLLGTERLFKKTFIQQIEKKQNIETAEQLKRIIFPFILRRTKENVAKELPPKVEQIIYCPMNEEQEKYYKYWKEFYRQTILNQIDDVGINKSKMRILEGLTKLRQIACHAKLVEKDATKDSGKFEFLKETLLEIISEDHKVLVFSQFVRMLTLIREFLDESQIQYEYLDGKTLKRQDKIDHFQNDDKLKIFLISLKAGGVGINLTAADYVIHYDPWWNPAVEMQATDRAHRIGQDRMVFVYKFITQNSVEEKIVKMQEKKKELVSQIISTDSSLFKSITKQDVEELFS